MNDLTRDVNDALRAEKMQNLWKEYGSALMVGAASLILGTAFFSGWNAWTLKQNQASTSLLVNSLESKTPFESLEKTLPELRGQTKALGELNAAGLSLEKKDVTKAMTHFDAVITDRSANNVVRDIARVQKAAILLDQKDTSAQNVLELLNPVIESKQSPFTGHAKLYAAIANLTLKDGNKKEGIASLQSFASDDTLVPTLKDRAAAVLAVQEAQP